MCSICMWNQCHPRCPNAPEPEPVMSCVECEEGIFEGDYYFELGDGRGLCKSCMLEMSAEKLMEMMNEKMSIAVSCK